MARLPRFVIPGQPQHVIVRGNDERQAAYRQLFKHHIPESTVTAIRGATNKAWVLGSDRFKQRIQKTIGSAGGAGCQVRG